MSERAVYWQRLLAGWERSGLRQAEFCRRRGIKAVNLAWWKRRLKGTDDAGGGRRARQPRRAGRKGFVEVALRRGSSSVPALRTSFFVRNRPADSSFGFRPLRAGVAGRRGAAAARRF